MQFVKMNGAGNDFIILDNRDGRYSDAELSEIAKIVCHRHLSVGADGLMAVAKAEGTADFRMQFFNADGSLGEMCGNGARCICRYGYEFGLAGERQTIETTAGIVTGQRIDRRNYRIRLTDPTILRCDYPVELEGTTYPCAYVELGNPGLPHAVVPMEALRDQNFEALRPLGRGLRSHPAFPKGANVNFYEIIGPDHLIEKTFERGVEDFTYACGTGTGSVAAVLTLRGEVSGKNVRVDVPGGTLWMDVLRQGDTITDLYLTGPTNLVCRGELTDEDLV
ncbi:MAG: diaminopimelate epimerase [Ruminococcaceae bacterium]|nr:diaminopimelate epimerase [Oscillospiraceae bacterium]